MGLGRRIVFGVACAFALVVVQAAVAATPPKAKDPCVSGTKDICGTTGVGYYKTYSFGTRWFGDFKNAIPGGTHSYCIDLRFWYPGPSYKYKEDTSGNLTNKSGGAVPFLNQQRIAYAIWVYGRSNDPDQAAAVMLYVHGQIDDARPGEVSPSVLGSKARSLYDQITKAAAKFHGPYKVDVSVPGAPKVGTAVTATVRVLAAGGAAVPNLPVTVSTHRSDRRVQALEDRRLRCGQGDADAERRRAQGLRLVLGAPVDTAARLRSDVRGRRGERAAARPTGLADGLRHGDRHRVEGADQGLDERRAGRPSRREAKPGQGDDLERRRRVERHDPGPDLRPRAHPRRNRLHRHACLSGNALGEGERDLHDDGGGDQGARLVRLPGDRPR